MAPAQVLAEPEHDLPANLDGLLDAFTLPAVPQSAGAARGRVRSALASSELRAVADDAELVVRELTANAVRHAGSPVDVVLIAMGGALMIIAADSSPVPPVMRAMNGGESGRGLIIVDGLADRWGSRQSSAGKLVWAVLRCTSS